MDDHACEDASVTWARTAVGLLTWDWRAWMAGFRRRFPIRDVRALQEECSVDPAEGFNAW